ncbi:MAG: PhoH family protein [Bacillota bacterium]
MAQEEIILPTNEVAKEIFGRHDQNLKLIEESFAVDIFARGTEVQVEGAVAEVEQVVKLFEELNKIISQDHDLTTQEIEYAVELAKENKFTLEEIYSDVIQVTHQGRKIKPKTLGQKVYVDAIRNYDIVFGIGPAGTGKSYLAVVMAVNALMTNQVNKIILTRPAIEAGENLGFLPGDLQEKVDPYLRPLYDSLYDVLGAKKVNELLKQDIIEIAPLAYMRGRTLKDSFVILDEAQNTTSEQMKMFLTRIGVESKAVVNGDTTQVDLPHRATSGLEEAYELLAEIEGVEFVQLTNKDVVRHRLVKEIINAYKSL